MQTATQTYAPTIIRELTAQESYEAALETLERAKGEADAAEAMKLLRSVEFSITVIRVKDKPLARKLMMPYEEARQSIRRS